MSSTGVIHNPFNSNRVDLSNVSLSATEKMYFVQEIKAKRTSAKIISRYHNIRRDTINNWVYNAKKQGRLQDSTGRPRYLPLMDLPKVRRAVRSGDLRPRREVVEKIIMDLHKENVQQFSASNLPITVQPPSKRTFDRILNDSNVNSGGAELTTNARTLACNDKRNAVALAAGCHAMIPLVNYNLIINMDATQFKVGFNSKQTIKVFYVADDESDDAVLDPDIELGHKRPRQLKAAPQPSDGTGGLTCLFIKYMLIMSAGGKVCCPVYILADDSLDKEEFYHYELPGLGVSTDARNRGYIVFCKTRCCNIAFYKWLNESIIVLFIMDIRSGTDGLGDTDTAWLSLDGEDVQIKGYISDAGLERMRETNIVVMKLAASTTEITQACDQFFIAPKSKLRTITDNDIIYNEGMISSITQLLKNHIKSVPKENRSAMKYKAVAYGLLRVQRALQLTYTVQSIQKCFLKVGIYNCTTKSYDIMKILENCKTKFSLEEISAVCSRIGSLGRQIGKYGELTEADFDWVGVEASVSSKDNKILNQRRVVFITNQELVERETNARLDKKIAAEVAEQKRLERKEKKTQKDAEKAKTEEKNRLIV